MSVASSSPWDPLSHPPFRLSRCLCPQRCWSPSPLSSHAHPSPPFHLWGRCLQERAKGCARGQPPSHVPAGVPQGWLAWQGGDGGAGVTSRRDPQCLLHSGPLGLLRGAPAARQPATRCHGGRGDGDSIHQSRDTLCQQRGDTAAPFTSRCPLNRDRRRDPIRHPRILTIEGTQHPPSLKSQGPATECNTHGHQLTLSFPEGRCPPSAPLPKSPETCVHPGRRGEG